MPIKQTTYLISQSLANPVQEDFGKLIGEDTEHCESTDTYLCSTTQYQKNTQNCCGNDSENTARKKVTLRRQERRLPPWILHQNRNRHGAKQTYPYKIKFTLPEQKQVDIRKNGDIIETINVC